MNADVLKRFWDKVDDKHPHECWEWRGATTGVGYGNFYAGDGRFVAAHRFSYELHFGKIPKGVDICHFCDNKTCVNPLHLWVGTRGENMKDAYEKGFLKTGDEHHFSTMPRNEAGHCVAT